MTEEQISKHGKVWVVMPDDSIHEMKVISRIIMEDGIHANVGNSEGCHVVSLDDVYSSRLDALSGLRKKATDMCSRLSKERDSWQKKIDDYSTEIEKEKAKTEKTATLVKILPSFSCMNSTMRLYKVNPPMTFVAVMSNYPSICRFPTFSFQHHEGFTDHVVAVAQITGVSIYPATSEGYQMPGEAIGNNVRGNGVDAFAALGYKVVEALKTSCRC